MRAKFSASLAGTGAIVALFLASSSAFAGPIEDRQAKMKTVGKSIGIVAKMAKGQAEFDSAAALQAYVDMKTAAEGFGDLFPDGTESGGDTEAAPAIFSDRAGFDAKNADFLSVLEGVTQSAPADLPALQASLGKVGEQCGICHKAYRVKKN